MLIIKRLVTKETDETVSTKQYTWTLFNIAETVEYFSISRVFIVIESISLPSIKGLCAVEGSSFPVSRNTQNLCVLLGYIDNKIPVLVFVTVFVISVVEVFL